MLNFKFSHAAKLWRLFICIKLRKNTDSRCLIIPIHHDAIMHKLSHDALRIGLNYRGEEVK